MTKIKKFKTYTCQLYHDVKRGILSIYMYRHNKLFYKTNIQDADDNFTRNFIKNFDEKTAEEIKSLEIENL